MYNCSFPTFFRHGLCTFLLSPGHKVFLDSFLTTDHTSEVNTEAASDTTTSEGHPAGGEPAGGDPAGGDPASAGAKAASFSLLTCTSDSDQPRTEMPSLPHLFGFPLHERHAPRCLTSSRGCAYPPRHRFLGSDVKWFPFNGFHRSSNCTGASPGKNKQRLYTHDSSRIKKRKKTGLRADLKLRSQPGRPGTWKSCFRFCPSS